MEDNKKLEFTYCGDIKIEFANILYKKVIYFTKNHLK